MTETTSNVTYPVVIRMSAALLDEFAQSEYGAYEDDGHPEEGPFPYCIAQRNPKGLEIRNDEDAKAIWFAICSGTFQLQDHHYRCACRVADQLKPIMEAIPSASGLLDHWRYPSGG